MNFKEHIKSQPIQTRIRLKWYFFTQDIKVWFIRHNLIKCQHEGTVGQVGAKYYLCLQCQKSLFNSEWKEDRKALKDIKR